MKPNIERASSFEEPARSLDIRFYKRLRVSNRIVVVRLGSVMHDCVVSRNNLIKEIRIANVANNKLHPTIRQASNGIRIRGIGQFI